MLGQVIQGTIIGNINDPKFKERMEKEQEESRQKDKVK